MSRIRNADTKPEITLRKLLWSRGHRYRIHYSTEGKPDIAYPSKRVAIFVDGCFWHSRPLHFQWPGTNVTFWENKIEDNVA